MNRFLSSRVDGGSSGSSVAQRDRCCSSHGTAQLGWVRSADSTADLPLAHELEELFGIDMQVKLWF
jgi:hypothetical protein